MLSVAKASAVGSLRPEYTVSVHDAETGRAIYSLTTHAFGVLYDVKWCAVAPLRKFRAQGGAPSKAAEARATEGSFAVATTKGIAFFAPTEGGGPSYEARKGIAGSLAKVGTSALCRQSSGTWT